MKRMIYPLVSFVLVASLFGCNMPLEPDSTVWIITDWGYVVHERAGRTPPPKWYHTNLGCRALSGQNHTRFTTLETAEALGYTPCPYPEPGDGCAKLHRSK